MRKRKRMRLSVVSDRAAPAEVEPSPADLAEIEREWPEVEAGLALLDAEIRVYVMDRPSPIDWHRLRRAEARVLHAAKTARNSGGYQRRAA